MNMSQDQWLAILRQLLPALGGIAVALGWLTKDQVGPLVANILAAAGPLMLVGGTIWAVIANTRASIMASAAKPVAPGVEAPKIVLPKEEAELAQTLPINVTSKT